MRSILQLLIAVAFTAFGSSCKQSDRTVDLKEFYNSYNVSGSFVMYDATQDRFTFYNEARFREPFSPASTFKIFNSLVSLETGVIADENTVIPWDSVVRHNEPWNADHDMKLAFKNSTVWFYQDLARRIGSERIQEWLTKCEYGNMDGSGPVDMIWLSGNLRITPEQQINFLKKLHDNQLPFSQRTMDIVKSIMIADQNPEFTLRAKTGWSGNDKMDIGWYVGYVEKGKDVYYFANCIQSTDLSNKQFGEARIQITYDALREIGVIENKK
jgi:beta-lactamase class D